MTERGLTPAHARVLWTLHHSGPTTQRLLAELLTDRGRSFTTDLRDVRNALAEALFADTPITELGSSFTDLETVLATVRPQH